jgi:hypothetical protein
MKKASTAKLLLFLPILIAICLAAGSCVVQKEKIGILFLEAGEDERYTFDWVIQYFNVFYDLLPPGFYAGGSLEGGRCYTLIHYADEAEAAICGVEEGTPIDAFCEEYTGSYPVHSILDHLPTDFGGDGDFAENCYDPDVPTLFILGGHTTVDPATGQTIQGPHVDDPNGSGIGLAEISESINFNNMPDYYRRPGQILPYRRGVLKWWFGNDTPEYTGYTPDRPELSNVKDTLQAALPEYKFVFRHGWEAYMDNKDPYGNDDYVEDSTETGIQELIDAGVSRIIVAHTYPTYANRTQFGHDWVDDAGQGISRIPGKTFKQCVEDITDEYGPKTAEDLEEYLTNKPWDSHSDHPWPKVESLVAKYDPTMDVTFAPSLGKYEGFEHSTLDYLSFITEKYQIPSTAALKVILLHHGNSGAYMEAQDCDAYYPLVYEMTERIRTRILQNFTWQGKFEIAVGGSEMEEGSSDPVSPDKPFGEVMGVGEHIDTSINGKYVNALGEVVDNGDDNFDYIITLHCLYTSESSDTLYRIQQGNLGNNIPDGERYSRDDLDQDGTEYDAGDVDEGYFTVKVFDATGWPSKPGCIEDPDNCESNETVFKGSAANPTTVILSGTLLSQDTGNQHVASARENLIDALVKAIEDSIKK